MSGEEFDEEEFERQYAEGVRRGKDSSLCGRPSPFDFRIYDEHGTVLEVEVGRGRWLINICQRESRSSMFITDDLDKLRRVRDALTRILESAAV